MFANLFKPKWRHPSPDVRVRAVTRLSTDRPEHRNILRTLLLDDGSSQVREAALGKVQDLELLIQVLGREESDQIRRVAASLIARQFAALPDDEVAHWISRLDEAACTRLAIYETDQNLHSLLVRQINSAGALHQLATQGSTAALRREAAERMDDIAILEQLVRDTRGSDKAVHRIARDRLNRYREAERLQQEQAEKRDTLLEALTNLVTTQDRQHYRARLEVIKRDWDRLPAAPEHIQAQFQARLSQAEEILLQVQAEQERTEAEAQAAAEHQKACEQCGEALRTQLNTTDPDQQFITELSAQINEAEQLIAERPCGAELPHYVRQAQALLCACEQLQEQHEALERLIETDPEYTDRAALKKLLADIQWPDTTPRPSLLERALSHLKASEQKAAQRRAAATQKVDELEADLQAFEQAIGQGEIRIALRHRDHAGEQLKRLNGSAPNALEQQFKTLSAQLQEMKDWQGFAVNGKKETLCEEMEALIGADMPAQALANRIRELQKEWKALDATSAVHSQKLWQRFHSAGETAYAPCEVHFSALRQQRQQNLAQREEICQQLETFLESVDWSQADWPAIEQICHTAKREWKGFTPVDRAPGKVVQQRFNQSIRTLDARLKEWHQRCADLKEQLIEEAAQLTEMEDLAEATEQAKALQRRWKEVGPAFRSQERALWQRFREHCDTLFARLKRPAPRLEPIALSAGESPVSKEAFERFISAAGMLDRAENAVLKGETAMLEQLLDAIRGATGNVSQPWRDQLCKRVDVIEEVLNDSTQLEQELAQSEQSILELCIRLEILLGQPSPEEEQARRMEYQMHRLQQALEEHQQNPTRADVIALELEWQTLSFNSVFPQQRQRFEQLLVRAGCC
ncbi:MAG: hypothetical protein CMI01_02090 [Oceanospirillaceae bacterium]|nr:hypothetical protein [Oceanospirillaceae bacterium]